MLRGRVVNQRHSESKLNHHCRKTGCTSDGPAASATTSKLDNAAATTGVFFHKITRILEVTTHFSMIEKRSQNSWMRSNVR